MTKIIIAGGRDVTDYELLRAALVESGYWKKYKGNIEVISGKARGADKLGEIFAERNGLIVHEFHADWDTWGKRAGHIRNRDMGHFALGHDGRLLALWDGVSKGTKGMIDFAQEKGLPGYIYRVDNPSLSEFIHGG